ncbi:hypothetical protein V6N12_037870 [Hibiscus sabdariffa]|uniref:Uncharacterized protein n=1 Tax=Hibiscus sabdariffa TaxID=183260 RepID=A0ABR2B032_9ROSI
MKPKKMHKYACILQKQFVFYSNEKHHVAKNCLFVGILVGPCFFIWIDTRGRHLLPSRLSFLADHGHPGARQTFVLKALSTNKLTRFPVADVKIVEDEVDLAPKAKDSRRPFNLLISHHPEASDNKYLVTFPLAEPLKCWRPFPVEING